MDKKNKKIIKNITASVKERLLNIARQAKGDLNLILLRYFQERFLYRASLSDYRDKFILKGGLLFLAYGIPSLRPTKDIDFLGYISNDLEDIRIIFKEIIKIEYQDGVFFDPENITVEKLKTTCKDLNFTGVRVKLEAYLAEANKNIHIDIGFGDRIVPEPINIDFPVLLNMAAPNIQVYSKESVIAEKFHSIVDLNFINSRMKDFYDILFLAENVTFRLKTLREAIYATFTERETLIEKRKVIYSEEYKKDVNKQLQWESFLHKNKLPSCGQFNNVVEKIELFLEPVCSEVSTTFDMVWNVKLWQWSKL